MRGSPLAISTADSASNLFENAWFTAAVAQSLPWVGGLSPQPARHLCGIGMTAGARSCIDELESFDLVGNPAPSDSAVRHVVDEPRWSVSPGDARTDPQRVSDTRSGLAPRSHRALRRDGPRENLLDGRYRWVFFWLKWGAEATKHSITIAMRRATLLAWTPLADRHLVRREITATTRQTP